MLKIEYDVKLTTESGTIVRSQGGSFVVESGKPYDTLIDVVHLAWDAQRPAGGLPEGDTK